MIKRTRTKDQEENMTGPQEGAQYMVVVQPDGRIYFPADATEEVLLETRGCDFWFNEKDQALGVRLLRGADEPPYIIERLKGDDPWRRASVEVGGFLAKVGYRLSDEPQSCPARFYRQYQMLEIRLSGRTVSDPASPRSIFDDYPALED